MELNSEFERFKKYIEIERELKRAERLHPQYPSNLYQQLAIMQEEAGEVTKAVLDYHYERGTLSQIREEVIQTAAMCMRMLENLPLGEKKIVNNNTDSVVLK